MKLATWNLECARPGAGARTERLRGAMVSLAPDVWVLTESHANLSPAPGYVLGAFSASAPDRRNGGSWVIIWHRAGLRAASLPMFGEPERTAALLLERPGSAPLLIVGTVLPWRGDKRYPDWGGAAAFVHSLQVQAADWDRLRTEHPEAQLCILGDFNQELDAPGPVGTRAGQAALAEFLDIRKLNCVTGGSGDPLLARGWRASIDHVVLSSGLRASAPATIWPETHPLPRGMPDHYGVAVAVTDA